MTKGVQADPTAFSYTPKDAAAMSKHTNLRRTMAAILRTGRTLSPDFREHVAKVVEEMDHARLLAAAPELAEALKEMLDIYIGIGGTERQRLAKAAARAALAKAGVE